MEKQLDISQLADQYGKSLLGETKLFEQFMLDYFQANPQDAFDNLRKTGASASTCKCAEGFHQEFLEREISKIQDEVQAIGVNPDSRQGMIMQEFYKDYFLSQDADRAWENVRTKIQSDPQLKTDIYFQSQMKEQYDKIRPQEKTGRAEMDIQEDESVFFKVRLGQVRKKFESKLTDYEIKKIMEDALKNFYSSKLSEDQDPHIAKKKIDVTHEVEAVYTHGKLPLAIHLAHDDVRKLTEKTTTELRNLDRNVKLVSDMTHQGIKFKFSNKDLADSVTTEKEKPKLRTGTEKVDVVRELIIDLRTRPIDDSFKVAIKKTNEQGDKELLDVLQKHFKVISSDNSINAKAEMLLDAYTLYVKKDVSAYKGDIKAETEKLSNGIKIEAVRVALDEIDKKRDGLLHSSAYNKVYNKAINSITPDEKMKFRKAANSLEEEVKEIAKRTGVKINLSQATAPPSEGLDQSRGKDLGAFLN